MPFMLVVAAIIGVFLAGLDTSRMDEMERQRQAAQAVGERLAFYHARAMQACPGLAGCPDGEVTPVLADLQSARPLTTEFTSVKAGGLLVSTLRGNMANWEQRLGTRNIGIIAESLGSTVSASLMAGSYNPNTGTIRSGAALVMIDGALTALNSGIVIPQNHGGLDLRNGQPLLVSRLY